MDTATNPTNTLIAASMANTKAWKAVSTAFAKWENASGEDTEAAWVVVTDAHTAFQATRKAVRVAASALVVYNTEQAAKGAAFDVALDAFAAIGGKA